MTNKFMNKLISLLISTWILTVLVMVMNELKSSRLEESRIESHSQELDILHVVGDDSENREFGELIQRPSYDINCQKLLEWDETETRRASRVLFKLRQSSNLSSSTSTLIPLLPDSNYIFEQSKCGAFRRIRGYESHKLHEFEAKFPIAFSILTYENIEQFERLLRLIYRPQNVYCIHVDLKSSQQFYSAVRSITDCFKNVFISTQLERVVYAGFSRLKADLNCMQDLLSPNYSHANLRGKSWTPGWKYLMNLASTEFPLRTNYELTRIMNLYNGVNDIEVINNMPRERVDYVWRVMPATANTSDKLVKTSQTKSSVPHNYTLVKGIAYCVFSRKFIEYVLTDQRAKDLLEWSKDTYSPDEWYWATLQYNVQFNPPGGFRDPKRLAIPTRSRYIGWAHNYKCKGYTFHNICIFSVQDLPELITRPEFFANKFNLGYDPVSYQCMEEWLVNKVAASQVVNMILYCRLLFVIPFSISPSCSRLLE